MKNPDYVRSVTLPELGDEPPPSPKKSDPDVSDMWEEIADQCGQT